MNPYAPPENEKPRNAIELPWRTPVVLIAMLLNACLNVTGAMDCTGAEALVICSSTLVGLSGCWMFFPFAVIKDFKC